MSASFCPHCGLAHPAMVPCPVTSTLPVPASNVPLPHGAQVGGRFSIKTVAHRSGMSTVYRASDLRNRGAEVALKEFNTTNVSPEERQETLAWLAREAGLLSTLDHPRLPKLLAAFSEGDRHYIAMPFLQGVTLEERAATSGRQPESLVLGWGSVLAELLAYLHGHAQPVIHRDLKPANVLLCPDGTLTLLDLGVARPLARGVAGTAVGTPGYAPPEQYQGLADERTDLYGLGATLHRLLTGYDPEQSAPFRHPPVRDLNPEVSHETAALVAALLELSPRRRPDNAGAVATHLGATLRDGLCRPLMAMHCQMLLLLVGAVGLGSLLYQRFFGAIPDTANVSGYPFKHIDAPADPLKILLIFAPALLVFLPLFGRRVRAIIRQDIMLRRHRNRTGRRMALALLLPLGSWLLGLSIHGYPSDQVVVPGQAPLSAQLVIGAIVFAGYVLIREHWQLRALHVFQARSRWYNPVLGAMLLTMIWLVILAFQAIPMVTIG